MLGGRSVPFGLLLEYTWEDAPYPHDLLPMTVGSGPRLYVHARPYALVPIRVALRGTRPRARRRFENAVPPSPGVRRAEIGRAQGWCYPEARAIVLWQCMLFESCRQPIPTHDATLATVWAAVEQILIEQLPGATWIVTPDRDFAYSEADWREFLSGRGFQPLLARAFVKELSP
jgi:hypothetical protein